MKNQKGITLIALVITIIVLLILAGVTISLTAGRNGALGKAKMAVNSNEIATAKEELNIVCSDAQMSFYDAWTESQNANSLYYFAKPSAYALNCQAAKTVYRATGNEGANRCVYIKYITQTDVMYFFKITIAQDDSFTIDNLPNDPITDQDKYKVVKGEGAISDADTAGQYDDVNPKTQEGPIVASEEYVLTEDTIVQTGKTYYTFQAGTYKEVTPEAGVNPKSLGYYEVKTNS